MSDEGDAVVGGGVEYGFISESFEEGLAHDLHQLNYSSLIIYYETVYLHGSI